MTHSGITLETDTWSLEAGVGRQEREVELLCEQLDRLLSIYESAHSN